jgi:hypothetical protein
MNAENRAPLSLETYYRAEVKAVEIALDYIKVIIENARIFKVVPQIPKFLFPREIELLDFDSLVIEKRSYKIPAYIIEQIKEIVSEKDVNRMIGALINTTRDLPVTYTVDIPNFGRSTLLTLLKKFTVKSTSRTQWILKTEGGYNENINKNNHFVLTQDVIHFLSVEQFSSMFNNSREENLDLSAILFYENILPYQYRPPKVVEDYLRKITSSHKDLRHLCEMIYNTAQEMDAIFAVGGHSKTFRKLLQSVCSLKVVNGNKWQASNSIWIFNDESLKLKEIRYGNDIQEHFRKWFNSMI